jgi:hypothetical protein
MGALAAVVNSLLFFTLSLLHFYWAGGGSWGKDAVVPTREHSSEKLFSPSVFSTLVVAIGLFLFCLVSAGTLGLFSGRIPLKYLLWINLVMGMIFTARSIGDFRYVGISKRNRDSSFARNDTRYYTPMSGLIALNCFLIYLFI